MLLQIYFCFVLVLKIISASATTSSVTSGTKQEEALSGGVVVFLVEREYGSAAVQRYSSWH